ncbi:MAG: MarR family transcriptional regulator, partial [Streptosporangiales bacterium]
MPDDRTSDLARRVIMHAALADLARLQITDTLLAGDASPSELAAMLAMPSNLLAHHLHVLEQAGIITRRRSEGDRRRTYLQLIPGSLGSLAPPTARAALRVLFVCTANSARSHLAAALWRQASNVPAVSAGTHPASAIDPGAIAAAGRHLLALPRLRITDTLLAGDASPSELAGLLAMPSNLLAHHLHVLEQAGIITRRRSEGDRRRTYLQLIPGALDSLAPPSARAALRVLFVCTANSARSHLAAALWRRAST